MSEREKKSSLFQQRFSRLCTGGDGSRDRGWAKTGGESSQGEEGQSGVNLRHGVRGEENINRACCAEVSCHGPLQEKD